MCTINQSYILVIILNIMKITLNNIYKNYNDKVVLNNLSLELNPAKRYAIVGANGVGKSSLLRIISGIDSNYIGQVLYGNKDIKNFDFKEKAKIISYMKQNQSGDLYYTVYELLLNSRYVYTGLFSKYKQSDYSAIKHAMEITNITNLSDLRIDELSGGQIQRVWLAFAIAQQSKWLMVDEPSSFLDIKYQKEMMEVFKKIENTGIISVMHDINFASLYFDEIIAIKDGEVVYKDDAKKFITKANIKKVFSVDADIITHPTLKQKICMFY